MKFKPEEADQFLRFKSWFSPAIACKMYEMKTGVQTIMFVYRVDNINN